MRRTEEAVIVGVVVLALLALDLPTCYSQTYNQTVTVYARPGTLNRNGPPDQIDACFMKGPVSSLPDLIYIMNSGAKYVSCGVYKDPVDDGAKLTPSLSYTGYVQVTVEGRGGIGSVYWVQVSAGGGDGYIYGNGAALIANIQDVGGPDTLVLQDNNTGYAVYDHTGKNPPRLYPQAKNNVWATVNSWMIPSSWGASYEYAIKQGTAVIQQGTMFAIQNPPYKIPNIGLGAGTYVMQTGV